MSFNCVKKVENDYDKYVLVLPMVPPHTIVAFAPMDAP